MTPSQLSIVVKSDGISKATDELNKLAQAGVSVDKETKDLIIASAKLSAEQAKAAAASAKLQTELKRQELVISRIAATEQAAADAHARSAQIMQAAEEKKSAAIERTSTREEAAAIKKSMQDQAQIQAYGRMQAAANEMNRAQIQAYGRMQAAANEMNRKFDEKNKKLGEVTSKGNVYVNTLRSMATAASAYLGVNFLRGIVDQADAWGMMQAKLSLALGSMNQAKVVQQDLYNVAQSVRVPLEDTIKLYTRMSIPLQKIGKNSSDTKEVVQSFSTALQLAGATGQEASSAMLQFSQSLNAGRLNGGEFNSVAEAAPNVLRAIEKELIRVGMGAELSTKDLKKLATEGKISTDILTEALLRAAPQWKKDFESLPLTFDGAMTRLKNAWQKAVGEIGQDTGFNKKLAESLKKIEEVLPVVAKAVGNAFVFMVDNAGKFLTILEYIVAATIVNKVASLGIAMWELSKSVALAATAAEGLKIGLLAVGVTPVGAVLTAIGLAGYYLYNVFKDLNKATDKTIENQKAIANSGNLLTAMKEETLELMRQADAARAKIGLPALYAKELNSVSTAYKEQSARIKETDAATESLMIAEKKILDYKKRNRLETDYYVPKNLKDELQSAKDRVEAIKKVNEESFAEGEKQANAAATLAAARRGQERQKIITEAAQNAKTVNQLADDARKESYKKLEKEIAEYDLPQITIKQRQIKIERDYQEALEKTKKLKETTMPLDLWKEVTDDRAKEETKRIEEHEKLLQGLAEENTEAEKQLEILKRQLYENDSIKLSKAEQSVVDAESNVSAAYKLGIFSEEAILAEKRLKIARDTLDVTRQIEAKDQFTKQADKYENAYQAANKKIQDGLYNAIGKGGGNAIKKLIEDIKSWFARLVLSPIIEPISAIGASIISPNAASAMSFSQGLSNLGSTASSAMNFLSNPTAWGSKVSASIANGIGTVGTTLGSGFLSSVSAGMSGMALEQDSAAGASSSLGFSIGSGLSAITPYLPYIAAVGLLAKGLSMGDKQMTGQTVTGNLGTNDLSRNVSWTQQGGFLRKDRSGTWSYNLANSTAIQDGRAYQDTSSMSSDKALLDQLNLMYSALKTSTADMAKSLNLSADEILKRNDAINFAFGKDAQETSSNITKAFESIANAMSKDLLGGLISLAKVGESSSQTLMRLSTTIGSVNNIFKVLGYKLFDINEAGIKSADALVTLYGGLDKFQSLTQSYYDNFYKESEKTEKALKVVKEAIKSLGITDEVKTREDFRAQVDKAQKAGNDALVKSLLELSNAFAQVVTSLEEMTYQGDVADMPSLQGVLDSVVEGIKKLASEAERWYNIRNQASSMQSSIDDVIGNPKKDPSIRMRQLWDAMAKDISPEQKLSLAGELKDLIISKYQVEKDSLTKLIDFGKQLRGYVDTLKVGSLSPLTMTDKLLEAKAQYESTLAKAQGGDTAAQGALQGKSEAYLQLAQTAFASSSAYVDIFNSVTSSLDSLGIESMSAADRTISLSESQLTELQRLKDFINAIEVSSNSYYEASLTAMYEQTKIANDLYARLGNLEGLTPILSGLPAEIAAALNGKANEEWVRNLYSTMAGKTGNAVDSQGLDYWMKEVDTYGKAYVQTAFQNSVNTVRAMAPSPMFANNQSQDSNSVVQEELRALKEELAKQTAVLAETILTSNQDNANTIVNGTNQNNAQSSWMKETMPTLN